MPDNSDHDILIRLETKVENLTDEVRLMRDGTKEDIKKLSDIKLDIDAFEEHRKSYQDLAELVKRHTDKLELHDKLIYVGMGILVTLQFVILVFKS